MRSKGFTVQFIVGFLILFFNFIYINPICNAQGQDDPMEFPFLSSMIETAQNNFLLEEVNSIDIELLEDSWSITDIELNFSNIRKHHDILNIEDHFVGKYKDIYRERFKRLARGTQIVLEETTILYGVEIYGYRTPSEINIFVQITGYNDNGDIPDMENIYLTQTLNMGVIPGWYYQNFSTPITLPAGNYYLVLNGLSLPEDTGTYFYWAFNDEDPQYPYLYSAEYNNIWYDIGTYKPHLYKLVVKSNKTYYPRDINMNIIIDDNRFNILNGPIKGTGYLHISDIEIVSNSNICNIPINTNVSHLVVFNVYIGVKLKNIAAISGLVRIDHNSENNWIINHVIQNVYQNYTIKFYYPETWRNISLYINEVDMTDYITFIEDFNKIIIPNFLLLEDQNLVITAISDKENISVEMPSTEYQAGQTFKIRVVPPSKNGILEFVLYDPNNFEEYRESVVNPLGPILFSYKDLYAGEWIATVYWYNSTNAGLFTYSINVTSNSNGTNILNGIQPIIFILSIIGASLIMAGSLAGVNIIKKHKQKKAQFKSDKYSKIVDTLSLNYVLVADKNSGLNVYEKYFKGLYLSPTLISGFLTAIRSFGMELTGTSHHSQTIKLEFMNSEILMNEYKGFRLIFILSRKPSEPFIQAIDNLSYEIYDKFGDSLKDFNGDTTRFQGITHLLEKYLQISLIFPMVVKIPYNTDLNAGEKYLVNKALKIMEKNNLKSFYISDLLNEEEPLSKNAYNMMQLIEKKIFSPLLRKFEEYSIKEFP
ncbi:MAG: hypothetical protein ACFFG0_40930 [Candidatus Thorarchaeota archaeon]